MEVLYKLFLALIFLSRGIFGATFTFANKCEYPVWPAILTNAGSPSLDSTDFVLPEKTSHSFQAPTSWSGRFWGRTGCKFDEFGSGSCSTGDCGSGQLECNGAGAVEPATLAEFTLGTSGQDIYGIIIVDGYNLAMNIEESSGRGNFMGAVYTLTFCPSNPSHEPSRETTNGDGSSMSGSGSGKMNSDSATTGSLPGSGS